MLLPDRTSPVVAAPMAGASTPALAAAVAETGGLGFLAAGYLTAEALADEIAAFRALSAAPAAVNVFTPQLDRSLELDARIERYRTLLEPTAARYGIEPGDAWHDDDAFAAKIDVLLAEPVEIVSFTFGPVPAEVVTRLRAADTRVGFTVTSAHEAQQATALGADFLVAQGAGAGGHRGTWNLSDHPNECATAEVVAAARDASGLPVMAAGGVGGPDDVAALLAAGAEAVAAGTLFLVTAESRAPAAHQQALTEGGLTEARVTRAFSGRWARALVNDFVREYDGLAPSAYPNVHHLTRPIRTAAAAAGDPEAMALWAGSGLAGVTPGAPAAEVARRLLPH